jgi:hypothetical protein
MLGAKRNLPFVALNTAIEEITSLKRQMEILKAAQGTIVGTLDSATIRVVTCETTLQQHTQHLQVVLDSQAMMTAQLESFRQ